MNTDMAVATILASLRDYTSVVRVFARANSRQKDKQADRQTAIFSCADPLAFASGFAKCSANYD